jgi:flavin-dependent dehydrogenase
VTEHAVVIAGGGPTGLMLAGELALAGVDVAVLRWKRCAAARMRTVNRPSCSDAIRRDGSGRASTYGASGAANTRVTGAPVGPP